VAAPEGAASLEPFQVQAVLHKQEHLQKWSQEKTRAHSHYKLAMGKRARGSQDTNGTMVVQEQQARTQPKWARGALKSGCALNASEEEKDNPGDC